MSVAARGFLGQDQAPAEAYVKVSPDWEYCCNRQGYWLERGARRTYRFIPYSVEREDFYVYFSMARTDFGRAYANYGPYRLHLKLSQTKQNRNRRTNNPTSK